MREDGSMRGVGEEGAKKKLECMRAPVDALQIVTESHKGVECANTKLGDLHLVVLAELGGGALQALPCVFFRAILSRGADKPIVHDFDSCLQHENSSCFSETMTRAMPVSTGPRTTRRKTSTEERCLSFLCIKKKLPSFSSPVMFDQYVLLGETIDIQEVHSK